MELLWAVYMFFRINNIDLTPKMFVCPVAKISQVMMKRRRRTSHLGRFTILCGTTAAELHNSVDLLCGTTVARLHNSVDLLCGATAAVIFEK